MLCGHANCREPLFICADARAPAALLLVQGRYRLGRKIGSGSFGDIYLGELPLIMLGIRSKAIQAPRSRATAVSRISRLAHIN